MYLSPPRKRGRYSSYAVRAESQSADLRTHACLAKCLDAAVDPSELLRMSLLETRIAPDSAYVHSAADLASLCAALDNVAPLARLPEALKPKLRPLTL